MSSSVLLRRSERRKRCSYKAGDVVEIVKNEGVSTGKLLKKTGGGNSPRWLVDVNERSEELSEKSLGKVIEEASVSSDNGSRRNGVGARSTAATKASRSSSTDSPPTAKRSSVVGRGDGMMVMEEVGNSSGGSATSGIPPPLKKRTRSTSAGSASRQNAHPSPSEIPPGFAERIHGLDGNFQAAEDALSNARKAKRARTAAATAARKAAAARKRDASLQRAAAAAAPKDGNGRVISTRSATKVSNGDEPDAVVAKAVPSSSLPLPLPLPLPLSAIPSQAARGGKRAKGGGPVAAGEVGAAKAIGVPKKKATIYRGCIRPKKSEGDDAVKKIKMLTGTLYIYRGENPRAEFVRVV